LSYRSRVNGTAWSISDVGLSAPIAPWAAGANAEEVVVQGVNHTVPTQHEIARWTREERAEVARMLDGLIDRPANDPDLHRRRFIVLLITGGGALLLFPWVVYLTNALPVTESGGAWRTAWVGFDVMLAATLAATAWLVWWRRAVAIVGLTASSALLVVDAWLDVSLSWGTSEQSGAIITAFAVNLPVSAVLATAVITMLRRTFVVTQQLRGEDATTVSLWRQPVVMLPPDEA
jgi:hypothetical protein